MPLLQKFLAFFAAFFVSSKITIQKPIALPTPTPILTYQVLKVIDGDTFTIQMAATEAKIRLLGIDTPELAAGAWLLKPKKAGLWSPNACKPSGFCNITPVLMYHHIQPLAEAKTLGHAGLTVDRDWFDQQVKYLSDNKYQFISVGELINSLQSGQILGKSVNYAYPILQKNGAKASLFIPTGLLQNPGYLTWNQVTHTTILGHTFLYLPAISIKNVAKLPRLNSNWKSTLVTNQRF